MPVSLEKKASLPKSLQDIWGGLPKSLQDIRGDKSPFMSSGKSSVLWYLLRQPWFQELSVEEREKVAKRLCPSLNVPSFEGV